MCGWESGKLLMESMPMQWWHKYDLLACKQFYTRVLKTIFHNSAHSGI